MNMRVFVSPPGSFRDDMNSNERNALGKRLALSNNHLVTTKADDSIIQYFREYDLNVNIISNDFERYTEFMEKTPLKKVILESDFLVFLPCSHSTLTLLSTAIDLAFAGRLDVPIIILNSNHFFDEFITMINKTFELKDSNIFESLKLLFESQNTSKLGVHIAQNIDEVLYLIENFSEYTPLSEVGCYGDYVKYPVTYKNVLLPNNQTSTLEGWRILHICNNYVYLVSAGTPLAFSFNKENDTEEGMNQIRALLKWDLNSMLFEQNGFYTDYITKAFLNKYTLDINIAVAEDFESQFGANLSLVVPKKDKYDLLRNGTDIYLLNFRDQLCLLDQTGNFLPHQYGTFGLRVIVTLKANVLTKGKDENGAWQLS